MTTSARPAKWRDLPPVDRAVAMDDGKVSATFLRGHDRCDRSAYLDLLHEGGTGSIPMNRGSIAHTAFAMGANHCIEHDEEKLAPETGKDLLIEAMELYPELTVSSPERDSLRAMMHNWCSGMWFRSPAVTIVGVELPVSLRIGNWEVRCRIDLVEQPHYGRLDVTDYKTAFAIPTEAEWEGDFQTVIYALALAFGETEYGLTLGADVEEFALHLTFPRYLRDDGLARRSTIVNRQQLLDFRLDLEHQLTRLEANLATGKWPATPGSHCSECVAVEECPLPRHLRPDSQMNLATIEDAMKIAEWIYVENERVKRARRRLKKWASDHGHRSIPIGTDREFAFVEREVSVDLDRAEFAAQVEGAVAYGTEVDLDKLTAKKPSTRFEERARPKEEPAE